MAVERKRTLLEGEQEDGSVEEQFATTKGRVVVRWLTPDDANTRAREAALSSSDSTDITKSATNFTNPTNANLAADVKPTLDPTKPITGTTTNPEQKG